MSRAELASEDFTMKTLAEPSGDRTLVEECGVDGKAGNTLSPRMMELLGQQSDGSEDSEEMDDEHENPSDFETVSSISN